MFLRSVGRAGLVIGRRYASADFAALAADAKVSPCVSFIGGGNMAQALYKGFLASGLVGPSQVAVSDPFPSAREAAAAASVAAFASADELLSSDFGGGLVFLAVKPQVLPDLLRQDGARLARAPLLASVIAGVPICAITAKLGSSGPPVGRVMPNTPAVVGEGASVLARGPGLSDAHARLIVELLSTVGIVEEVPEAYVDAVTALSGSGPAFIYTVIEALSDGSVENGLPRHLADRLAAQTVLGAASMVVKSGEHPAVLRSAVCSPGGTTIAGVVAMEQNGARRALIGAVNAAYRRAKDLGDIED